MGEIVVDIGVPPGRVEELEVAVGVLLRVATTGAVGRLSRV